MSWSILEMLRKEPERLKEHVKKRLMDPSIVDQAVAIDTRWRQLLSKINEMRHKHNKISEEISRIRSHEERIAKIEQAKKVLKELEGLEAELKRVEDERKKILYSLPNIVDDSVPIGDESASRVVRVWGLAKVYREHLARFKEQLQGYEMGYRVIDWKPVGHADMLEKVLGLGNTVKASEVAGSRFYYIFDDIVWLDIALQLYAVDIMTSKGYTLVVPPYMLRGEVITAVTDYMSLKDAIYKVEGEDLYLIGTAEHSLAALHKGEDIDEDRLPIKYVGMSPCFRKEAGAGNRDLKGIFRVHQFHKIEQFIYALPEQSWDMLEELISNSEELFRGLELPYRVINIASGDLGAPAAKKYDLEVWMPAQGLFREMVSASNDLDWQSYRLRIKYVRRKGRKKGYVHTLNSTAIASTRTITAILENNQDPEGVVEIPKILRRYLEIFKNAPKDYIYPSSRDAR